MNRLYGYTGKIARIDLTTRNITFVDTEQYLPDYPGGKAMSAKIYWDEIPPETKPFDPENKLIFTTSPLNGTGAVAATKCEMTTKAPGYWPGSSFVSTNASMLAPWLKRAGFDGLIIEGCASHPSYIAIDEGSIEIRDATHIWGLNTFDTREILWKVTGKDALVACIGQAGENRNIYAAIMVDQSSCFARGGVGAVMGSKNLKAFTVRGNLHIRVSNPLGLIEENLKRAKFFNIKYGEERIVHGQKIVGNRPPDYIMQGTGPPPMVKDNSSLTKEAKQGRISFKPGGCDGCVLHCRTRCHFKNESRPDCSLKCASIATWSFDDDRYGSDPFTGHWQDPSPGSYDYSVLCDGYGLDNFVFSPRYPLRGFKGQIDPDGDYGSSFSFGDMLYQAFLAGILTEENTGIPWSRVMTKEYWEQFLHMLTFREGFGDVLAEGPGYLAEYVKNHEEFGPDREKIDFLYHRMNPKKGHLRNLEMGHGAYSPNPIRMLYAAVGDQQGQEPEPFWDTPPMPDNVIEHYLGTSVIKDHFYWGPEVASATVNHENLAGIVDIYGICCFMTLSMLPSPAGFMTRRADGGLTAELVEWDKEFVKNSDSGVPELLSCVSGKTVTNEELTRISERALNLIRAIWVRDGYADGNQDLFWDEVYRMKDAEGRAHNPQKQFLKLLEEYYRLRGWKKGVPTRATLESLDMKYVADELEERGMLPK